MCACQSECATRAAAPYPGGKKLWKVYAPRSEEEMLPRYSSPNFEQDEIGEPVLEAEVARSFVSRAHSLDLKATSRR